MGLPFDFLLQLERLEHQPAMGRKCRSTVFSAFVLGLDDFPSTILIPTGTVKMALNLLTGPLKQSEMNHSEIELFSSK